jgi:putative oxidoreductase
LQALLLLLPERFCGSFLAAGFKAAKSGLRGARQMKIGFYCSDFWFHDGVAECRGILKYSLLFCLDGAFGEAIVGIFLPHVLQIRIFSFIILCTMLVVAFMKQMGNGAWNILPEAGFAWVALFTIVPGDTRIGVDYLI